MYRDKKRLTAHEARELANIPTGKDTKNLDNILTAVETEATKGKLFIMTEVDFGWWVLDQLQILGYHVDFELSGKTKISW